MVCHVGPNLISCPFEFLENQGLQAKKMEELAFQASDTVYGKEDSGPYECLRFV